jgi:hypothetical protein
LSDWLLPEFVPSLQSSLKLKGMAKKEILCIVPLHPNKKETHSEKMNNFCITKCHLHVTTYGLFILCTGHQQRKRCVRKSEEHKHKNVEIFQQI